MCTTEAMLPKNQCIALEKNVIFLFFPCSKFSMYNKTDIWRLIFRDLKKVSEFLHEKANISELFVLYSCIYPSKILKFTIVTWSFLEHFKFKFNWKVNLALSRIFTTESRRVFKIRLIGVINLQQFINTVASNPRLLNLKAGLL